MTDQQKIAIAREFLEFHAVTNIEGWVLSGDGDARFLNLYCNLEAGVYGEVELTNSDTFEYMIEIDSMDSSTGKPVLFAFNAKF